MKVKYEMDGDRDIGEIVNEIRLLSQVEMDLGIQFEVIIKRGGKV